MSDNREAEIERERKRQLRAATWRERRLTDAEAVAITALVVHDMIANPPMGFAHGWKERSDIMRRVDRAYALILNEPPDYSADVGLAGPTAQDELKSAD